MPMSAPNREDNISSGESSDEYSYTSMSPIREGLKSSGLSKSMELLDAAPYDAGVELGHSLNWDGNKSRSYSQSTTRGLSIQVRRSIHCVCQVFHCVGKGACIFF